MLPLTPFEKTVLDTFLQGNQPQLAALRAQIPHTVAKARTHTGVGSFIDFVVAPAAKRITPTEMVFGDVDVQVEGVTAEVSTILYVVGGHLHFLEFAADAGEWPKEPAITKIGYLKSVPDGDGFKQVPCDTRDADALARSLMGPQAKKRDA
jgi:hypothetical protein